MKKLKFYIGERHNIQLKKTYYKIYGQLTKKEAENKSNPLYGYMYLTSYETEIEYNQAISHLKEKGYKVY